MGLLGPFKIPNFTNFLTLCLWVILVLLDLVNAQATEEDAPRTYYYWIFIPGGGACLGAALHKCCGCGKSEETQTSIPTNQTTQTTTRSATSTQARSTTVTTTQSATEIPGSFTRVSATRTAPVAEQTNISAETFMSQRMRERQNRNRDRIYSIPIELNERSTGWTMTTYPNTYIQGENENSFTNINPLYTHDIDDIPNSVLVHDADQATSHVKEKNHSEELPPSYYSLFRSKQ